jgi:hypothetical protein
VLKHEIKGPKKTRIEPISNTIILRIEQHPEEELVFHGIKFSPDDFKVLRTVGPYSTRQGPKLYAKPEAVEKLVSYISDSPGYQLPDNMPSDWLSNAHLGGEEPAMRLKNPSRHPIR